MDLDVGGIDRKLVGYAPGGRRPLEQPAPDAAACPSVIAIVECLIGAMVGRRITPAATRLENVQYTRDHPPIVHATRSGLTMRQMRFDHPQASSLSQY